MAKIQIVDCLRSSKYKRKKILKIKVICGSYDLAWEKYLNTSNIKKTTIKITQLELVL